MKTNPKIKTTSKLKTTSKMNHEAVSRTSEIDMDPGLSICK